MKNFLLTGLLFTLVTSLFAQKEHPFENEIRAFERLDSIAPPATGQVLLYGSSTMRLWTTCAQDLDGFQVVRRGFGGSEMSDAVYYFDRVVLPLRPSWILLYEGDNDLWNSKKTPEQIFADYLVFMQLVKEKLPGTRVAIYSLRPSLARESAMLQQRKLNAMFKKYCRQHRKTARYIDVYDLLLTPEGRPNGELLVEDKLHMNAKGYAVWTKATRDFLKKSLR